jgi:hypothetical protein
MMAMFLNFAFCALLFIVFPKMLFRGYRNQGLRTQSGTTRQGGAAGKTLKAEELKPPL